MFANVKPEQKQISKDTIQKKDVEKIASLPNQTGIPDFMKTRFENLSEFSFDDVRVHYNSGKPAQLQALAYTQGNQVYIGPGQEKHLGHELGHVVQQKQGRVQPIVQLQGLNVNNNEELERDADALSERSLGNLNTLARSLTNPIVSEMQNASIVQMQTLYRFGTKGRADTIIPKSPVPETTTISKHCDNMLKLEDIDFDIMEFEGEFTEEEKPILIAAEFHSQNSLGTNNCNSPFLSLCRDCKKAAEAGTIKEIVDNTLNIFEFKIPDDRIVPVGNGISYKETEVLAWLKEGERLDMWLKMVWANSYNKKRTLEQMFEKSTLEDD